MLVNNLFNFFTNAADTVIKFDFLFRDKYLYGK